MKKAYRRTPSQNEVKIIQKVWQENFTKSKNFEESIKEALVVVLTSPQFLYLIENSETPKPEVLADFELASKLSYLLWNTSPDAELINLAQKGQLNKNLDKQITRMIAHKNFYNFSKSFTYEWLHLDMFDKVEIDRKKYPALNKHVKSHVKLEPIHFVKHLIQKNLPAKNLIISDFTMANDVVATYYGYKNRKESGLKFVPVKHEDKNRGGLLTQVGILAGLSDGRESNPVRRGTWIAKKIVDEPPGAPPPVVPGIDEIDKNLSLRKKLELHRKKPGCMNCHKKIDPWGMPFEGFDAAGMKKPKGSFDTKSKLPDGKQVANMEELKKYLSTEKMDRVAYSFMKHLAIYSVGRSLTFNEVNYLKEKGKTLKSGGYKMQDIVRFIIKSDIFLKK